MSEHEPPGGALPPPAPAECAALGRLEDLPADYVASLRERHLVPLWPSLRALLPPDLPARRTRVVHWAYTQIRPLLLRAGELTPIAKAERRVLVLANPGHGPDSMQASSAIYLGMQLLLPGEWAPSHRHTPNAVRMVVEGEGAWTNVSGQKLPMSRGDLILTPTGLWHEHGHDGDAPVVWLDVLDLPLVHYLETSYHVDGGRQPVEPGAAERRYARGGLVPSPGFGRRHEPYPMLRYPWSEARAALLALADETAVGDAVQLEYVNPETGAAAQNLLGFHALMLRPGQTLTLPVRSPAAVFHVIEGGVDARIGASAAEQTLSLAEADTCCVPGYTPATLANRSRREAAFVFVADEAPLHRKLGVHEVRT